MIITVIPAKGDSRRLSNKNMELLYGKPMLYYSLKIARECSLIDKVYVSTDSEEISEYAKSEGAEVIRRGPELGGEAPVVQVYRHALEVLNDRSIEFVVALQPDHPDRKIKLDDAINYALRKNYEDILTVDGKGFVNGSVRIMKAEALLNNRVGAVGTLMDDCTNVHHLDDLKVAETNLRQRKNQ